MLYELSAMSLQYSVAMVSILEFIE